MKKMYLLLCLVLLFTFSFAKNPVNAYKDLMSGKKAEALKSFLEINKKDSVSLIANYSLALLYSDSNFSLYDLELSYRYSQKANKCISSNNWNELVAEKELKDIEKTNIKPLQVRLLKDSIVSLIYGNLLKKKTINGFKQFVKDYPDAKEKEEATQYIYTLAWAKTIQKLDDISGYEQFIKEYPDAKQAGTAKSLIELISFDEVKKKNTKEAYEQFIAKHPEAKQIQEAKALLHKLSVNNYFIIEPKYNYIGEFNNGLAVAKRDGKWGCIAVNGTEVFPFQSEYIITDFHEDMAPVKSMKNEVDRSLFDIPNSRVSDSILTVLKYSITSMEHGLDRVKQKENWGYVDKTGKITIPLKYYAVGIFHEGFTTVIDATGKVGCLNYKGDIIIPCVYDNIEPFKNGIVIVNKNNKYGCIDKTGKIVIPIINDYDYVRKLEINRTINKVELIPNQSDSIEGLIMVHKQIDNSNFKDGFIDRETKKEVVPTIYDELHNFHENLALARLDNINDNHTEWHFIDKTGSVVISLSSQDNNYYCNANDFHDGLSVVGIYDNALSTKYGCINKGGNLVISFQYDYISNFDNGVAIAKLRKKYGCINKVGSIVIPIQYDYIGDFSNGLAPVNMNHKWGLIDKSGKIVIPLQYDFIANFEGNLAIFKLNDKWGVIDNAGNEIAKAEYSDITCNKIGLFITKNNNKWGVIGKTSK